MNDADRERLLAELKDVYSRNKYAADYDSERGIYEHVLEPLASALAPLEIQKPLACGSTATIWQVFDHSLQLKRALKFPRPRLARLDKILRVLRAERENLSSLNHQNIVKVYLAGELDEIAVGGHRYSFPYFLMEFLDEIDDFDRYLVKHIDSLSAEQLIAHFRDAVAGVDYLHRQDVIHCDLKPGNMLISPTTPTLIADLGYSKKPFPLLSPAGATEVTYTPNYAHPRLRERMERDTDPNANVAELDRADLQVAFDLYALGRSFKEVLKKLAAAEKESIDAGRRSGPVFSLYQWRYLALIAIRLLDGEVEYVDEKDPLSSDVVHGLPRERAADIKYLSAEEAVEDCDRLLNLYDLEGQIPELNPNLRSYIQVPGIQVPLTNRVQVLIDHPLLARLSSITQLGFVNLVYPGATHTRFEHVIGTFAHCCESIRALWYDESNCFFRSVMRQRDIESLLAASLLHDVAQYPMGHDLAEVASEFDHDRFTDELLVKRVAPSGDSLADTLERHWGLRVEDVTDVLGATPDSSLRARILRSILNGPLDCDKIDYLSRDSTHLGVAFGRPIDLPRLRKNLTVVWDGSGEDLVIEVGVAEKALAIAEILWRARHDMFRQVYWQHSIRSLKAMLAFVVRSKVMRNTGAQQDLLSFIINPLAYSRRGEPGAEQSTPDLSVPEWLSRGGEAETTVISAHLHPSDDALLSFLASDASPTEGAVLEMIRDRRLFKRFVVLSAEGNRSGQHADLYTWFRELRLNGSHGSIETQRQHWESLVLDEISIRAGQKCRELIEEIRSVGRPGLLVDIPVKALRRGGASEALWYVPEERMRHRWPEPSWFPAPQESTIEIEGPRFDTSVGKIRFLLHPDIHDAAADILDDVEEKLASELRVN